MVKVVNTNSFVNEEKRTIVTIITDEYNNQFKGQSWCSEEDEFNVDFGEKLAYLRAKRKMVRFYKKANENQLIATRKSMADFETRMARELDKHENVLNKVNEAIEKMLSE